MLIYFKISFVLGYPLTKLKKEQKTHIDNPFLFQAFIIFPPELGIIAECSVGRPVLFHTAFITISKQIDSIYCTVRLIKITKGSVPL
jgi:hypothetical protein